MIRLKIKRTSIWLLVLGLSAQAQTYESSRLDIFCGAELNYRDIFHNKVYEFLINLTPGIKWYMSQGWMAAAQEDYGVQLEVMKHFKHCTVDIYGEYSDLWGKNGGFKIIMMIPPYKRKQRKVNFRPASNFRLTNNVMAYPYSNLMYTTDPEENEREGWFDRQALPWGVNRLTQNFTIKQDVHE